MMPTQRLHTSLRSVFRHTAVRYGLALVSVVVAFALRKALEPATGTGAPFVLFFGAIVSTAIIAGAGPALLAILLSAPLAAYEFVVRAGYRPSQAAVQALLFAGESCIVVYLSVLITRARREAERAGQRLQLANETAAIVTWDLELQRKEVCWTGDVRTLLGVDEQIMGVDRWMALVYPEDREAFTDAYRRSLDPSGTGEMRAESRIVHADGSVRWFAWTGRTERVDGVAVRQVGAAVDITEQRRRADELKIFAALLENSSDFIGIADPSGKPLWGNRAARRMVGLPPDFPIEQTQILDYYPPSEREFATNVILKSMIERGQWSGETYFRNWQTGESIPVSDEHFMIRDPSSGRVLGMGTVTRDISEARRIRDQLQESEERFRLTIEEAPIGMTLVALDGRFVRVNRRLCEIVGYSTEELQQKTFRDITHPDDLQADLALVGQLTRGEIPFYQLEKRYIRKDGSSVPIMLSASILRGSDGAPRYYIAQIEDISHRKRAEEALRFSEARFSGIVSISADAIISVDAEQRITLFNRGAETIFGYAAAEVMGAPLDLLIPERLRDRHREHVAGFAAGPAGARRMGERLARIAGRRKSGEEFPADAAISKLEVDGKTIVTVALRDVTELRRVEREQKFLAEAGAVLSSSLDYEQTLVDVAGLIVRDLADWCMIDVVEPDGQPKRLVAVSADPSNAALCQAWERIALDRAREHLVRPAMETKRPFLIERVADGELDAFAQGPEHLRLIRGLEARSLLEVPLVIRGQLFGVLALISSTVARRYTSDTLPFAQEIAMRAALAIQNGRLYDEAVRATRLRDQVLGFVAHDLRNPLSLILMNSQLLQRKAGEPERRNQRPVEQVERAAKRMNRLIRDLLDVSAIEAGQLGLERSRVAAESLLADVVDAQRPIAAAGTLELRAEVQHPLPDIWADSHRMSQVLENLIGNATKFTAPGGQIVVGAAPRDHEVLFWVTDTGPGIAPDDLSHVFDRFWQARRGERKGAGLGLAISRGIIEAHGGRVWVESSLGRGTTFFFMIPQALAAQPTSPNP